MKFGSTDVDDFKFGDQQIDKVMVGENEVWSHVVPGEGYRYWGISSGNIGRMIRLVELHTEEGVQPISAVDSNTVIHGLLDNVGNYATYTDGNLTTGIALNDNLIYWDTVSGADITHCRIACNRTASAAFFVDFQVIRSTDGVTWEYSNIISPFVQPLNDNFCDANYMALTF